MSLFPTPQGLNPETIKHILIKESYGIKTKLPLLKSLSR